MWSQQGAGDDDVQGAVAVAVDKDKGSQNALKWAVENIVNRGQTLVLIHVVNKQPNAAISDMKEDSGLRQQQLELQYRDLFRPFRCFCARKDIQCKDFVREHTDVAKALIEFVSNYAIENLILGASTRGGFVRRFKSVDVPTTVCKGAPDFCSVYVISKGKVASARSAIRPAPARSPFRNQAHNQSSSPSNEQQPPPEMLMPSSNETPSRAHEDLSFRSPFVRSGRNPNKTYGEQLCPDTDISFVSSGRPSIDRTFPSMYDYLDSGRASNASDFDIRSFDSSRTPPRSSDVYSVGNDMSSFSQESSNTDEMEAEMKRLRLELKQTMDMYNTACKEALAAKQKARELHRWKLEEEQRIEESRMAEEAALAIAEKEKAKCRVAVEKAEVAQRIAELESQKRMNAEMKAQKESEEKMKALDALAQTDVRYRKYTIEEIEAATEFFAESRKIGEGGYGPVFRCHLDHTPVAVKVLRPDAAQGRSQFQQEVEVLSCIRHPNMVLLLGACPEYGCLVYEYMANGSLEDRLFQKGSTPVLPWQLRFRIAAEIGTGLLFLHQTKPEPLVHRDLKPANILLDRNFVSKISDVGLARLVPPNIADSVTQYRMTSTAGTFCYIDPEYQQTGMLGIKSDIYSLGIMLLQIITAKSPMGLTHHVERAIEKGTFAEMLDPAVTDWPVEEALVFANLALKCAEMRRKDRPDLGLVVLPELNRLRALAEEHMNHLIMGPNHIPLSRPPDIMSEHGYVSTKSRSSSTASGS